MACSCGFLGDLAKHWAHYPTCLPAYASDLQPDLQRAPRPRATDTVGVNEGADIEGARELVRAQTVRKLGKLILKDKVRLKSITELEAIVADHNEFAAIATMLESTGPVDTAALRERFDAFEGLDTEKKLVAALKAAIPHVSHTMRPLGEFDMALTDDNGDELVYASKAAACADFDIYEGVALIVNSSERARQAVYDFNVKWAAGTRGVAQPSTIADFEDSLNFLEHPGFLDGIPAGVLKIPVALEADEADNCNAVGISAGKFKIFNFVIKLLPLPPKLRSVHKYLIPACHAIDAHVSHFGDLMVVGGVDEHYRPLPGHESSLGAQLREEGRTITVGAGSSSKTWRMQLYLIGLDGDYLGDGKLGCTSVSAGSVDNGTYKSCRQCPYDRRRPNEHPPNHTLPVRWRIGWDLHSVTRCVGVYLCNSPPTPCTGAAEDLRQVCDVYLQSKSHGILPAHWHTATYLLLASQGASPL